MATSGRLDIETLNYASNSRDTRVTRDIDEIQWKNSLSNSLQVAKKKPLIGHRYDVAHCAR